MKIWGLFANGRLEYFVLPADGPKTTNMNGARYNRLVKTKFRVLSPQHDAGSAGEGPREVPMARDEV